MMQIAIVAIFISLFSGCVPNAPPISQENNSSVERAFAQHQRDVLVEGEGVVSRILPDDTSGSPHQKFIVRLPSGQTVLIEHNTELAPRIADLKEGDSINFFGEYVWNAQGGLVHWTHHDPAGKHPDGWIRRNGQEYK